VKIDCILLILEHKKTKFQATTGACVVYTIVHNHEDDDCHQPLVVGSSALFQGGLQLLRHEDEIHSLSLAPV